MKSLTAVCQTGATMPTINPNGRAISRHQHPQRENAEMKMYLSKLKDLVPFMPKNRKLSKLEIIQHVIDYICDLQSELEAHPEMSNFDAASALNFVTASQNVASMAEGDDEDLDETEVHADEDDDDLNIADEDALTQRLSAEAAYQPQQRLHQQHQQQQQSSPAIVRQPLADRQAPNTILPAIAPASHVAAVSQQQQHQQQQQQQQPQLAQSSQQTTSAEKGSRQNVC